MRRSITISSPLSLGGVTLAEIWESLGEMDCSSKNKVCRCLGATYSSCLARSFLAPRSLKYLYDSATCDLSFQLMEPFRVSIGN